MGHFLLQRADRAYCTVVFEPYWSEYGLLGEDWIRVKVGGPTGGEVVHRPSSVLLRPSIGWDCVSAVNRSGHRPSDVEAPGRWRQAVRVRTARCLRAGWGRTAGLSTLQLGCYRDA